MQPAPKLPDQEIPVVDVGPFIRGEAGSGKVVEAIEAAARDMGFFLVTGHGVSPEKTMRLYNLARGFFDLEEDYKRAHGKGNSVMGGMSFSPLADEALAATKGIKTPGDYKESLNYGPRLGGGVWSPRPEGLEAAFHGYFAEMETLARHLRRIFCRAIGLDADYFEADFVDHLSALRVINYPDQQVDPLAGSQLAALVLLLDLVEAAPEPRLSTALVELLGQGGQRGRAGQQVLRGLLGRGPVLVLVLAHQRPFHSGSRFSKKALTPSIASSLESSIASCERR